MKKPEKPTNEAERIKDLLSADILDTPSDQDYDHLVQLAVSLLKVPIAIVSLVDVNRQWFKSCIGLPEGVSETPRDISFCGHAINTPDDIFIVPDATKDERFFDNPLVTGDLGVVFYAGAPLISSRGNALGTLCIIDTKERTLTSEQVEQLKILAHQVSKLIELRIYNIELDKSLNEKVVLLKEIHHRVKNNLQLVSSMLNIQASSFNNEELSNAIMLSQNRIKSIALIHEQLYQSNTLSEINLSIYLHQLIQDKKSEFYNQNIQINHDVTEKIVTIDQVLPIGLIINELVINSIKHACNGKDECIINLIISSSDNKNFKLLYNDNGPGLSEEDQENTNKGIGMILIESLTEQLKEGSLSINSSDKGLYYEFNFIL